MTEPRGPIGWANQQQTERKQPARKLLDQMSDAELTELYERAEKAERRVEDWRTAAGARMTLTEQLRGQLDDTRRTMTAIGLIGDTTPDSDASLAALLQQGFDAFWARMQQLDQKADKQLEELIDMGRHFKARAEQAEAANARIRTFCDELDATMRQLTNEPTAVHPVAEKVRHRLAEPKEPRP